MGTAISSIHNPLVKNILRLQQKVSERRQSGLFVAEGRREVSLALASGIKVQHLLVCREIYSPDPAYPINGIDTGDLLAPTIEITLPVYNKLAYRKDKEGVILVGLQKNHDIEQVSPEHNALVLVLEAVEKPGNLGAILRTADAAGIKTVILADPKTDMFNPNAIRASLGCVFTLQVIECSSSRAIQWLKQNDMTIYAAALQTDTLYYAVSFLKPVALVFGSEDTGLSIPWREASDQIIKIPMSGTIDSLNVSASVAILAFEAVRQRKSIAG